MKDMVFVASGGEVEQFEIKYNASLLALYIVFQAIKDYRESRELLKTAKSKRMRFVLNRRIAECEDFFKSGRCKDFCAIDGKVILEHIDDIKLPSDFI